MNVQFPSVTQPESKKGINSKSREENKQRRRPPCNPLLPRTPSNRLFRLSCHKIQVHPLFFSSPRERQKFSSNMYVCMCVCGPLQCCPPASGRMTLHVAAELSPAASSLKCNGTQPAHRGNARRRDPKKQEQPPLANRAGLQHLLQKRLVPNPRSRSSSVGCRFVYPFCPRAPRTLSHGVVPDLRIEVGVQVASDLQPRHCRVDVAPEARRPCGRVRCGDMLMLMLLLLVDRRGLELEVFGLQFCVRLTEHVVARLGVVEHLLQVLDPLVLALPVGSLRGAVLCSAALFVGDLRQPETFQLRALWGMRCADDVIVALIALLAGDLPIGLRAVRSCICSLASSSQRALWPMFGRVVKGFPPLLPHLGSALCLSL